MNRKAKPKSRLPAPELFVADCIESVRAIIEENEGNEVFLLGQLDERQKVNTVEPMAFGSPEEVPAPRSPVKPGMLVIHNHPSGDLEPSQADLHLAAEFASEDVGFYIIDNAVERVRVVVRPLVPKPRVPLAIAELLQYFEERGELARSMPEYEYRPEQLEMCEAVAEAFNRRLVAVIEAGTGIGKSLAYLIPAISWARQNQERIVVSTNTINLQEQLIYKDLPLIRDTLKLKFEAVLMKGRHNYLCLRKLTSLKQDAQLLTTKEQKEQLEQIFGWAEKTVDGSLSDLNVEPSEELWEQCRTESETCLRVRCPFYERCFFYRARRLAARADIIITNHHLLMADLSLRLAKGDFSTSAVLPPLRHFILDEAHNVEDAATSYFGYTLSPYALGRILGTLVRGRRRAGLLPVLVHKLFQSGAQFSRDTEPLVELINEQLIPFRFELQEKAQQIWEELGSNLTTFINLQSETTDEESTLRVSAELRSSSFWEEEVKESVENLMTLLLTYTTQLRRLLSLLSRLPEGVRKQLGFYPLELRARADRLGEFARRLNFFYSTEPETYCRWFEFSRSREPTQRRLRLCVAPISVAEQLRQSIFQHASTVVLTSATLAVARRFEFLFRQLGLEEFKAHDWSVSKKPELAVPELRAADEPCEIIHLQLPSTFDFDRQVLVAVPSDFSEPRHPDFGEELVPFVLKALLAARGRAFVLFTSYNLLNEVYERLQPVLTSQGYLCLRQGEENRHRLLNRFREEISSILFATASFWEGVDVKGKALQCLILTKLPFRVPTHPVLQARAEYVEKQGGDPFRELELPYAVIKFKQGFGRLIRARDDRGVVVILDRRLFSRSYGKVFLNSLPTRSVLTIPQQEILSRIEKFLYPQGK